MKFQKKIIFGLTKNKPKKNLGLPGVFSRSGFYFPAVLEAKLCNLIPAWGEINRILHISVALGCNHHFDSSFDDAGAC